MEFGVKESSKNKLVRSRLTIVVHMERMKRKNWLREQVHRKTEIATGACIKGDLERMREEWRERTTYRMDGRLPMENAVRRRKNMETEIMVNSTLTTVMARKEQIMQIDISLVTGQLLF